VTNALAIFLQKAAETKAQILAMASFILSRETYLQSLIVTLATFAEA